MALTFTKMTIYSLFFKMLWLYFCNQFLGRYRIESIAKKWLPL